MKLAERMTEREFQDAVVKLAQLLGYRVAHFRNARTTSGGHATPVAYDGRGFPDLVLCRPGDRVIFAELKSQRGRLSDHQHAWIDDLTDAGIETYVWRPDDWDDLEQTLRRREPAHG